MADEETGNKSPETETAAVEPNVPIWVKWGGKGLALIGAISWCIAGIFTAIGFNALCLFVGILEIFLGMFIIAIEASIFCKCIQGSEVVTSRLGFVKWWMKSLFYIGSSILCIALCATASGALPFCMIFGAGVCYGYGVFLHRKETGQLC